MDWKIAQAKKRFSEMVHRSRKEPQRIFNRDRFVAVVIDPEEYIEILPVTATVAKGAGIMRGQFQARGIARTQADLLIAATASVHGLTLVTRNTRDFDGCGIALLNPFR